MKNITAYVVDDDTTFCMLTRINIGRINKNIEVVEINSGTEAVQAVKEKKPSIIFLDINMTDLDGWEFLEKFDEAPDYPIYIISSSINPEDIKRAENHPYVEAYLEKPIGLDKLRMAFSDIMGESVNE